MEIKDGKKVSPRSIKSAEVRKRILNTGYEMIRQYGIDMVGIRDIAEHAGVSTGTLYYYFKNKEEILWAHAQENSVHFLDQLAQMQAGPVYERIVSYCSGCLADIVLEDGPDVIIWILQRKQTSKGLFEAILSLVREGIASGEFTTEKTPEELTDFILDCYRGATYAWYRSDGTIDLRRAIAEHVGFALEHFLRK